MGVRLEGLFGTMDELLVFRGEQLYSLGPTYSGAPLLDVITLRRSSGRKALISRSTPR